MAGESSVLRLIKNRIDEMVYVVLDGLREPPFKPVRIADFNLDFKPF